MLATALIPIGVVAALIALPSPDVHWVGSANAYTRTMRAVLFLSTVSCTFSLYLAWRSFQAKGLTVMVALTAVAAAAFLIWAVPLIWGVVEAVTRSGVL